MKGFLSVLAFTMLCSVSKSQTYVYQYYDSIPVIKQGKAMYHAWAGGVNSVQFNELDLDLDGIMDLVLLDRTVNKVLTFINLGIADSSSYIYSPQYESYFPPASSWLRLADYNCDGKNDLFTWAPGGIRVYKNITSGGFPTWTLVESLVYSYQPPNNLNLYVSSVDMPAIDDVDYDGDLDVLTFGVLGTSLEYHKNLSMETYGICDSLIFELKNQCWGHFAESSTSNNVILNYTGWPCSGGSIVNPEMPLTDIDRYAPERKPLLNGSAKHSGSTVMMWDMNGDGVRDLLIGDVSFPNLVNLENGGTAPNQDSPMTTKDTVFPYYNVSADVNVFPSPYYQDVDNDAISDLIVTTNSSNLSVDKQSVWLYKNNGVDDLPVLDFQKTDFLQEYMIEQGTGSAPVIFDWDADGLKDLVIGTLGSYDILSTAYLPGVGLYRNSGTASAPEFTWVTDDFSSLSTSGLPIGLHPAFGDLDNDGDEDMIVGDSEGNLHYFQNTAGAGNTASFVLAIPMMTDQSAVIIDLGYYATPQLIDIDRDGDLDIVSGKRDGKLAWIKNKGSVSAPVWEVNTTSLGGVDVREWFELPNGSGYSVPFVVDFAGAYELFVGSKSGYIFHYNQIDGNLAGTFTELDTTYMDINPGQRSSAAFYDFDNDGVRELLVGNYRGGLLCYNYRVNSSDVKEFENQSFVVYPNPASDRLEIQWKQGFNKVSLKIIDPSGRVVYSLTTGASQVIIPVNEWSTGVYIILDETGTVAPARVMITR
jgi:hypothetical protein